MDFELNKWYYAEDYNMEYSFSKYKEELKKNLLALIIRTNNII